MAGYDVFFTDGGRTLNVWFDHPYKEHHSEIKGENTILRKDDHGHVIGIEQRNYYSDSLVCCAEDP